MISRLNLVMVLCGTVLGLWNLPVCAQCTKDIECRGDRICEKGVCVRPPAKPSAVPTTPPTPAAPKPPTADPTFDNYRVEYLNRSFRLQIPSSGNKWIDDRQKVDGPVQPNFGGRFFILRASCGTGCSIYRLFDLTTNKEYALPFGGEQETKSGDSYTTFLEFEKDSTLIRAVYNVFLKSRGTECRQRFFSFRDGKLSSVSQTTRTTHIFCL